MGRPSKAPDLCEALSASLELLRAPPGSTENSLAADSSSLVASDEGRVLTPAEAAAAIAAARENVHSCLQASLKRLEVPTDVLDSSKEEARGEVREFLTLLILANIPVKLASGLDVLEFEAQKDAVRVFQAILRASAECGVNTQIIQYVQSQPRFIQILLQGCGRPEVALHCGLMLRACTRYPELTTYLLETGAANELVILSRNQSFDIASDAFSSLRELLLTHKSVSSACLGKCSAEFFGNYHTLLQAEDYITQRQALRLLGEVLLNRVFMSVMISYVGNEHFLQIHMNLLRNHSKAIQLEAFHVFKIFVVNPRKPLRVHQILYRNKERLVKLLDNFHSKKADDEPFAKDLRTVLETLRNLAPVAAPGKMHLGKGGASPVRCTPVVA